MEKSNLFLVAVRAADGRLGEQLAYSSQVGSPILAYVNPELVPPEKAAGHIQEKLSQLLLLVSAALGLGQIQVELVADPLATGWLLVPAPGQPGWELAPLTEKEVNHEP